MNGVGSGEAFCFRVTSGAPSASTKRFSGSTCRELVEKARVAFVRKWRLRSKAVVTSLEEAGEDLFTFLRYPNSQWKSLRTTNALERINEEFRRRTKTQASLPSEDAVLLLLL